MHTNRSTRSRKIFLAAILGGIIFMLCSIGIGSSVAYAQKGATPFPRVPEAVTATPETVVSTRYYSASTLPLSDGTLVEKHVINGPSVPPAGLPKAGEASETAIGDGDAPDYVFGCSTTAALTIVTLEDRGEVYPTMLGSLADGVSIASMQGLGSIAYLPNLYTGPTNGGVMPLDNSAWPTWTDACGDTFSNNPLAASHAGVDGRPLDSKGTIDDYWVCYESPDPDPYLTGGWTQHAPETLGDFMGTSQSAYGNTDGSTSFYTYPASNKLFTCDEAASENLSDGTLGRRLFYESRGYAVPECYNRLTDNKVAGGFSLADFKAEIDAGRPVMLGLEGHNVVGVGYDTSSNDIYIRDGWDYAIHTMPWGGSYADLPMFMVSMANPAPPAHTGDYTISGYVEVPNTTITYTGGSTKAGSDGYYSFSAAAGWDGTVTPSKPGYTFEPPSRQYEDLPGYQTAQNYTATSIPGSNLIQDPSFEDGSPNPKWTQTSTHFGTPLYEGEGARTGSVWGWFGGTEDYPTDTATLSQTVTIPQGSSASLDFYFAIDEARAGSGLDDVFTVKVDGTQVFSANATQIKSYAFYTPVSVDVSAYANGSPHTIQFKSVTSGQVVAFYLDDVSLAVVPVVTYTISGNAGVPNATLTYTGGSATADGSGNYSFTVLSGWSGTVTPSYPGFLFTPASQTYEDVTENITQNYTANAIPFVATITRMDSETTDLPSVRFTVTFTESVTGVSESDFIVTMSGVSGAGITDVTGSGTSRTVTVSTGSGIGTIRLDLIDHDNIQDGSGIPLGGTGEENGNFHTGEVYTITSFLTTPALLSPANGSGVSTSTPSLDWNDIASANRYDILFATDSAFSQNMELHTVIAPPFTFGTALADGRYYWRVQAYDSRNSSSGWSATRYFTIDTALPSVPAPSLPANNVSTRGVPMFRWSVVSNVVRYQFEIDNNLDFSSPLFSVIQRTTYRRLPGILRGMYYWRVRSQDAAGNWSDWSPTFTVTFLPPR